MNGGLQVVSLSAPRGHLPEAGDDREGLHNGKMTEGKGNQFRVEEKFRTLNHIKKQCIQEPFVFVPAGTQ